MYKQELNLEEKDWYKIVEENQELLSLILSEKSLINPRTITFAIIFNYILAKILLKFIHRSR
jgi:hypothetical protein